MPQALLYNIKVTSNWAQVMTKDTAATNSNTKSKVANTAADKAADRRRTESTGIMSSVFRMIGMNTDATDKSTASKKRNWYIQRLLNKSTKTAGFNVGGLSLRIHESLVPAMAVLYTSMLPVIAGLLAIGSAAIVAVGGIAGVAAIGLLGWSKQYKDAQESGGFAGGRQPLGLGTGGQGDFMSEVMSGFTGFMDNPKVQFAIDWTENLFKTTLPQTLNAFLNAIDINQMKPMLNMFTKWLPDAAKGLATWGQALFSKIGPKSLQMINDIFKWIAVGLLSIADWLNDEGFGELESLGKNMADFAGSLMELGKEVLPLLNEALKAIYPNPFKPVVEGLTDLLGSIGESESGVKVIKALTVMFASIMVLKGIEATVSGLIWLFQGLAILTPVAGLIGEYILLIKMFGLASVAFVGIPAQLIVAFGLIGAGILLWISSWDNWLGKAVKFALVNLGALIINTFKWILNRAIDLVNMVPGVDFDKVGYNAFMDIDGSKAHLPGTQVVDVNINLKPNEDVMFPGIDDWMTAQVESVTKHRAGVNGAVD